MTVKISDQILRNPDLMSAPMDDELVILNISGKNYIGLDSIGRTIWEMLTEPRRAGELRDMLGLKYDAQPEHIEEDLLSFLGELKAEGMISIQE